MSSAYRLALMALLLCGTAYGQQPLSPKQLIELMTAQRNRITSLDVELRKVRDTYEEKNPDTTRKNIGTSTVTVLWTPSRSYSKSTSETGQTNAQWVWTEEWTKQHTVRQTNGASYGRIEPAPASNAFKAGWPYFERIWDFHGLSWEKVLANDASVEWDEENGVYVLESNIQGNTFLMSVDPAKGHVPTSKKWIDKDGKVQSESQNADFAEIQPGLWLPRSFHSVSLYTEPGLMTECTISITRCEVNKPIAEERLDFTFPPGTRVRDNVRGERYVMGPDGERR